MALAGYRGQTDVGCGADACSDHRPLVVTQLYFGKYRADDIRPPDFNVSVLFDKNVRPGPLLTDFSALRGLRRCAI